MRDDLKADAARRYVPRYVLALAAMAVGEKDEAFSQMEKEVDERGAYGSGLEVDPNMDDFRDDPPFTTLLRKSKKQD